MQKQYFKVTDLENKIFNLIVTSREGGTVVASHNAAANRVTLSNHESFSKNDFSGVVTEIDHQEYNEALAAWGHVDTVLDSVAAQNAEAAGAAIGDVGNDASTSTPADVSEPAPTQPDAVSTESGGDVGNESSGEASEPTLSSGTDASPTVDSGEDAATAEGMPDKAA